MKSTTAFSLLFLSISQLTGCVFSPGQNLSVSGKKVISAEEANYQLDKRVEIFSADAGVDWKTAPARVEISGKS